MNYNLAIIGAGPRGLAVLEFLFKEFADSGGTKPLKVALFEKGHHQGCSWVYYPEQPETNWLNILDRPLNLKARETITWKGTTIPGFPGYHQWNEQDRKVPDWEVRDSFTTRGRLGVYLKQRFDSLTQMLINQGYLEFQNTGVIDIKRAKNGYILHTESGDTFYSPEVILCVGHQNTKTSKQLLKWEKHVESQKGIALYKEPYPVEHFMEAMVQPTKSNVALRGFGLSMIDIVRALTEGLGGEFKLKDERTRKMEYIPGKNSVPCLIPFSLDGLPLAPKPLNKIIDDLFKPSDSAIVHFLKTIKEELRSGEDIEDIQFVVNPVTRLCAEVFAKLESRSRAHNLSNDKLQLLLKEWIAIPDLDHPLLVAHGQSAKETMRQFVDMATGDAPSSLDYCFGQVWRHLQPLLYEEFAFTQLKPAVMARLIDFDERIKRYSYGPPVDALQQQLALIQAGVLKLIVVDDPDIKMVAGGWLFKDEGKEITANVMINTVLDSPDLEAVTSPMIYSMVQQGLLTPYYEGLGAKINSQCMAESDDGEEVKGLALIGRLAKGSILGADAILECFNPYIGDWAKGYINRLTKNS